jgi:hypothetical protein
MRRPSFGSRTKREIELKLFELLYRERLAAFVLQWPRRGTIERDGERLRVVVDDPFLRDLLQNFAYARGLAVDLSFSREIVTLTWPTYVALVRALAGERGVDDALATFAAEIRAGLREQRDVERAFRQVEQEAEKVKKTDRFVRYAKFAVQYALPVVEGVRGLTG